MKNLTSKFLSLTLAAVVAVFLLAPEPASAVVKSFQVMQNGQPVAKTKVTLTSPSGKTYQEETDEDGKVIGFLFNEDGDWTVSWAGGSMIVNAGGGVGPWLVGATAIGVTAAIIVANDSDNDDGPTEPPSGGGPGDIAGAYVMLSTSITSNPDGHPDNFPFCTYNVAGELNSDITIQCDNSPTIAFIANGSVDGSGNFSASGPGTYSGFSTNFVIEGAFGEGLWQGTASGCNGGCPDTNGNTIEEPIEISFSGGLD